MFTQKDVADYYNTTQNHYQQWWNLDKTLSLHYGIWDKNTKSFSDSLLNTNKVLLNLAQIESHHQVLDAGCGVGGAAVFIAQQTNAQVTGITLSQKQLETAQQNAAQRKLQDLLTFKKMDYTQTHFPDNHFDVVWACESVSSAPDKRIFIAEAFRILKKGGRLILSDFFTSEKDQHDPKDWMKKWGATWGITEFVTTDFFESHLHKTGFSQISVNDYTAQITKSAKRMFYASMLGAIPSEMYNLFHPNVSRFAKTHYKCGLYQYWALQEKLWKYQIFQATK